MGKTGTAELAQEYIELKRELREAGSELYKAILSEKGIKNNSHCRFVFDTGRITEGVVKGYVVGKDGTYLLNVYQVVNGLVATGVKPEQVSIGTLDRIDWAGITGIYSMASTVSVDGRVTSKAV